MTQTEAYNLQLQTEKEAIALLRLTELQGYTSPYETVIRIIGKVWGIPQNIMLESLEAIEQERIGNEVYDETQLPMNALPGETLQNILGLLETAAHVEQLQECKALVNLALELAATQNLLDTVELHTREE